MKCVIAAGGGAPTKDSALYHYTQGKPRALIDMGGRAMLERVVDAVQDSHYVSGVVIVGLDETSQSSLNFKQPVHYLPDHGSMINNFQAGISWLKHSNPASEMVLLCSADLPHLTGKMIDDFIELCQPFDYLFYYPHIEAEAVKRRYPAADRYYTQEWTGGRRLFPGDIFLINTKALESDLSVWSAWERDAWKHYPKLAEQIKETFGANTLESVLKEELSDEKIFEIVLHLLGGDKAIKLVISQYAELAMDADQPHRIELLRAEFSH